MSHLSLGHMTPWNFFRPAFAHAPRIDGIRGGVALIYRTSIIIHRVMPRLSCIFFEWLDLHVCIRHKIFRLVIIYRPTTFFKSPPFSVFITEFSSLLGSPNGASDDLIITGDFNIHVGSTEPNAVDFEELLVSFGPPLFRC